MEARIYHHLTERGFRFRLVEGDARVIPADQLTDRDRERLTTCGRELKAFVEAVANDSYFVKRDLEHARNHLVAFDFETGKPCCQHCGAIAAADGCHVCEACRVGAETYGR